MPIAVVEGANIMQHEMFHKREGLEVAKGSLYREGRGRAGEKKPHLASPAQLGTTYGELRVDGRLKVERAHRQCDRAVGYFACPQQILPW